VRLGSHALHASSQLRALEVLDQSKDESEIEMQMNASNSMLAELGVYQHHDAMLELPSNMLPMTIPIGFLKLWLKIPLLMVLL